MKTRTLLASLALLTVAACLPLTAVAASISCTVNNGGISRSGTTASGTAQVQIYGDSQDSSTSYSIWVVANGSYIASTSGSEYYEMTGNTNKTTTVSLAWSATNASSVTVYANATFDVSAEANGIDSCTLSTPVTIQWSTSTPTFNGSWQTGATATISPAGAATISGDSGLYAGTYTASASLVSSDYYWAGGQTTAVNWSIAKAHRNLNVGGQSSGFTNTGYTFIASPDAGGGTITWDGGGTGVFNSYSWNTPGYYTVSAWIRGDPNYEDASGSTSISIGYPPTYSVFVTVTPDAARTAGCTAWASPPSNILAGQSSYLSASAAPGWQFSGFSSGGSWLTNIQSDITVTANFSALPVHASISVSPSSDTAPGATTVSWGADNATSISVSGTGVGSSAASGSQYVAGLSPGSYTYTISASGPGGSDSASATFTVSSKPVSFTFGNLSQTYDGSTKTATVTCSDSSATFSTDLTKGPDAGSYTVSASAYGDYTGSGSDTLTINQAAQSVSGGALTLDATTPQMYGTTQTLTTTGGAGNGAVSYAITGQSAAGVATLAGANLTANAGAGWVELQATKADDGNYFSATSATVRVNLQPKTLTPGVTAANKVYDGTTAATITGRSLTGVLGADDVTLTGGTAIFASKIVGNGKTVTVSGLTLGGADAGNYSLTPPPATTAAITPATPTITWATPAAITYGTPLSATQLNATASVPGTLTYTPAAGTVLNAGAGQTLQVNFVPTDSVNYTTVSATTTITVNKADQTVTLTPLASAVPLGTPIAYTAAGGATGVYVWGGTAGASGGGTIQTVTLTGGLGNYTVTVYAPGNSNYNDSPPVTAPITAQAQTIALSLTPLVSNYTVDNASSPLNGKTYKRVWQDGGAWHAYLGRSGEQFQIVGQATTAVQAFELQALEPNADPSAWYSLATIAPPTGAPNGPGVGVTGVFSVSLDTASAAAALVPQSYAQGSPKTGVWQLRARTQDSSGTWSDWSNIVAVTVDLPLTTKTVPAQSLPPAGPIGGWFTASDQTTFNLPVWIP
jgi:uncharacterized protein YaiE (UPF0345 family)